MAKKKSKKKSSGGGLFLIIVLVLVAGLGGWNYNRNLHLESSQSSNRPFMGYSDGDLEQLAKAYEGEAAILERNYKASLAKRDGVRTSEGLISDKIEEFERVRDIGNQIRIATAESAERDARIREIHDEQAWRRNEGQAKLHLKRLTSL